MIKGINASLDENRASSSTGDDGPSSGGVGVDWGTIAVYTCTGSCGNGELVCEETGCYREEVAWMQPPLD